MVAPWLWYRDYVQLECSKLRRDNTLATSCCAVQKIQLAISECGECPKTKENTAGWPLTAAKGLDGCLLKMMGLLGF